MNGFSFVAVILFSHIVLAALAAVVGYRVGRSMRRRSAPPPKMPGAPLKLKRRYSERRRDGDWYRPPQQKRSLDHGK